MFSTNHSKIILEGGYDSTAAAVLLAILYPESLSPYLENKWWRTWTDDEDREIVSHCVGHPEAAVKIQQRGL